MKLTGPRKKRLTLKQLIASLVIEPETGAVIWAGNRQKQRGPNRNVSDGLKTDETRRFENHCPQELNGSSMRYRLVGCRSES